MAWKCTGWETCELKVAITVQCINSPSLACSLVHRSIRPLYVRLVHGDSAEGLRQNRERLSTDITDLINEYAPKVFNDFDRKPPLTTSLMPQQSGFF